MLPYQVVYTAYHPIGSSLAVVGTSVKRDAQGRYCLNDLHRAAGGENKQRPSLWLVNQQTKDLIEEIAKAGIPAIESKQGVGTFVCKELVYAYAMWISPRFNVQVVRNGDEVKAHKEDGGRLLIKRLRMACACTLWSRA